MAQFVGTISKITGTVIARAPDGAIRELQLGDDVYQGEVLITAQGAIVEVTVPDAPAIVLPGGRELLLNGEVTVADRDTAADAGLDDETLDQVVAALESGANLDEILEETAAGGAGNEGSSFIRLGRIGLDTPTASADTDATAAADAETSDADYDADLQLIEDPAEFAITGGEVAEGNIIVLTITRTGNTDIEASVDVATLPIDAAIDTAEDNDFTALGTTTVVFAEGQTEVTIEIQTTQDIVLEGAETFRVGLSNPSAESPFDAVIAEGGDTGTVTILDDGTGPGDNPDDDTTGFSVDSAEVLEGGVMVFTVTRTGDADFEQTVDFATSIETDDTAEANDFQAASGTLTFAPGEVTQTFTVQTNVDGVYEGAETFTVTLSNNSEGSEILQPTGTGTILDGSSETVFSVDSVEVLEGGVMTFTITREGDAEFPQTVDFATSIEAGDTAEANDFNAVSGTVTFAPGETSQTFTVQTNVDAVYEGDETFTVTLSNNSEGSTIGDGTGVGTIIDGQSVPTVTITGPDSVPEAADATYIISLSGPAEEAVSVELATSEGSAQVFYDYTGIGNPENLTDPDTPSGPFIITFAPGETEVEVTVDIRNDLVDEPDENYSVLLSNVEGPATLGVSSVTTTIIDDDENQGPDAVNDAFSTDFETDVGGNVLPNDSDPENDPLTVTTTGILTTANGGAATIDAAGNFTYSPPAGFSGVDTFVYTITDGNGGSDSAVVTITVAEPVENLGPVAADDTVTTPEDTPVVIGVLSNDTDPDSDAITVISAGTQPQQWHCNPSTRRER